MFDDRDLDDTAATGDLVGLELAEGIRARPAADSAREIMATLRLARIALTAAVTEAAAATGGDGGRGFGNRAGHHRCLSGPGAGRLSGAAREGRDDGADSSVSKRAYVADRLGWRACDKFPTAV